MARVEILVEEPSMEYCLTELLPKILSPHWTLNANYFIRRHQGKSDLKRSISNKIRGFTNWHEPVAFVILLDQDSADCKVLKAELRDLCGPTRLPVLIRIVCRELESWYLGDLLALERAYPKFQSLKHTNKATLRKPDLLGAKEYLKRILPDYSEITSSKKIAKHLNVNANKSESFAQFVSGVTKLFSQMESKK